MSPFSKQTFLKKEKKNYEESVLDMCYTATHITNTSELAHNVTIKSQRNMAVYVI